MLSKLSTGGVGRGGVSTEMPSTGKRLVQKCRLSVLSTGGGGGGDWGGGGGG